MIHAAYGNIPSRDMWFFSGHGNAGVIAFYNGSGTSIGFITADNSITAYGTPIFSI